MSDGAPAAIFVHLPKTAGMSLFVALCEQFGPQVASLYGVDYSHPAEAVRILRDPQFVVYCGHFSFGLHRWMTRPALYFAVAREPVRRIVSLYYFMRRHRQRFLERCGEPLSVGELCARGIAPPFYEDFGPWIEGRDTLEAFLECPAADLDNGMVRRFSGLGHAPGRCPDSALELAQRQIAACFSVVGLIERYPETLQLLRRTLGWPNLREQRVNARRAKAAHGDLAPPLIQRIERMNALDCALHAWICERFERQLREPAPPILVPPGAQTDPAGFPAGKPLGTDVMFELWRHLKGDEGPDPELGGPFVMPPIA